MGRLAGKVAIVTGAGRLGNIGVAICDAFLREGAKGIVGTDLRDEDRHAIQARFEREHGPGRFTMMRHDVTSETGWAQVVGTTLATFGQLDVLVNNAGISFHGGIIDTSLENLRKAMAVNHDALFLGMKHCAPHLETALQRFSGGGSIVNNLSMASYMPNANNLGYHVSKAAGRMLTLCGAVEFGPKKIRVNSVHPGTTMTPIIEEAFEDYVKAGMWESRDVAEAALNQMAPLNKSSQPEETANAFVYLASEESGFVTGASIYHDGGLGLRY